MFNHKISFCIAITFLLTLASLFGCSGGGGGGGDDGSPPPPDLKTLEVSPTSYDFGIVTFGNSAIPLNIKIINTGTKLINIRDIVLSDTSNFALTLNGGPASCNSPSPVLPVGTQCTVTVSFQPTQSGVFTTDLTILSDSPSSPVTQVDLKGIYEAASNLTVSINQVENDGACPAANITAYVSVLDQGGYPVKGLLENHFSIFENNVSRLPLTDFNFAAEVNKPMSVAFALDYSGSITDVPENMNDMQDAVADFIRQLAADDEAEIIKFDSEVEVVQGFTSDKTLLIDALYAPWDKGRQTSLYDAVIQAAQDTAGRSNPRKAVIVVTDGEDKPEGVPTTTLNDVITSANTAGIPVFTIGMGNIQDVVLKQIAADTGGQFYEAATSDNLGNVYQQLVDLLLENQYILTYVSGLGIANSADLNIKVDSPPNSGEAVKRITPCP